MADRLIRLDVRTREQWRQWLRTHHASSPGIWLVRHKQHSSVKTMPYEDVVRQALCFGWIDSLVKRLDDNRYAIKVAGSLDVADICVALAPRRDPKRRVDRPLRVHAIVFD